VKERLNPRNNMKLFSSNCSEGWGVSSCCILRVVISRKYRLFEGMRNMKGGLKIVREQVLRGGASRGLVLPILYWLSAKEHRIEVG